MIDDFLLDIRITFLNHGSFQAASITIFDKYHQWQEELARHSIDIRDKCIRTMMAEPREKLAEYLRYEPYFKIYFSNPTTMIKMTVQNLNLDSGG